MIDPLKWPLTALGHQYAVEVAQGDIMAGELVRLACERHLRDLERTDVLFHPPASERFLEFTSELRLIGGSYHGQRLVLIPWQAFAGASAFGWMIPDAAGRMVRRFLRIYVETAKGSGKSPLASAVGLFGTYADGEGAAENFVLATNAEQSGVIFQMAAMMIMQDPALSEDLQVYGGHKPNRIVYPATQSYLALTSTGAKHTAGTGKSGPIPHISLVDEYHEFRDSDVVDMLEAGTKHRRQPMTWISTNSGTSKTTPCGEEHAHAHDVLHGIAEDDRYFAFVAVVDEGDEPLEDEGCWLKANPSLDHGLPTVDYLKGRVAKAKRSSLERPKVERLNFGIWRDSFAKWIMPEVWLPCETEAPGGDPSWPHWLSLDLSDTTDLSALSTVWRIPETDPGRFAARVEAWLPGEDVEALEQRDRVPYRQWAEDGHLTLAEAPTIDLDVIAEAIRTKWLKLNLEGIAVDTWHWRRVAEKLDEKGVPLHDGTGSGLLVVPHPQTHGAGVKDFAEGRGLHMPSSTRITEELLRLKRLAVERNPLLSWAVSNVTIIEDGQLNPRPSKGKSAGRIDPAVALIMGTAAAYYRPIGKSKLGDLEWIALEAERRRALKAAGALAAPDAGTEDEASAGAPAWFGVREVG